MYSRFLKCVLRKLHKVPRLLISVSRYTYMSGEMKIERYTREGKRERVTSVYKNSNYFIKRHVDDDHTLAGAILYAKRSCNPALARGACAGVHVCRERASDRARVYARAGTRVCLVHDISCTVRGCTTRSYVTVHVPILHTGCAVYKRTWARMGRVCVFRYATPDRVYP